MLYITEQYSYSATDIPKITMDGTEENTEFIEEMQKDGEPTIEGK